MENSRLNYAYAAGLFEGEGTVSYSSKGSWIVAINMTDLEPLERIYRTMGGRLLGPYGPYTLKSRKPHWLWSILAREKSIRDIPNRNRKIKYERENGYLAP